MLLFHFMKEENEVQRGEGTKWRTPQDLNAESGFSVHAHRGFDPASIQAVHFKHFKQNKMIDLVLQHHSFGVAAKWSFPLVGEVGPQIYQIPLGSCGSPVWCQALGS